MLFPRRPSAAARFSDFTSVGRLFFLNRKSTFRGASGITDPYGGDLRFRNGKITGDPFLEKDMSATAASHPDTIPFHQMIVKPEPRFTFFDTG